MCISSLVGQVTDACVSDPVTAELRLCLPDACLCVCIPHKAAHLFEIGDCFESFHLLCHMCQWHTYCRAASLVYSWWLACSEGEEVGA